MMDNNSIPRREVLLGLAGGAALNACDINSATIAVNNNNKVTQPLPEVRLEYLRPKEIEKALQKCPVLFLPLGTIEWHGLQNIVGLDAVKAHLLCIHAAQKGGGLVVPPLFGGVGGLDQPYTFVMEPEDDIHSILLRSWVERLCREAARQNIRGLIILTGHYGAAQQIVVREVAVRMSRVLSIPVLGTPEYMLALDQGYTGDHAAWGETSLMMHLLPDSVDLSQLGEEPHKGVFGRDPKKFAAEKDGRRLAETIINRLASLAEKMPAWDKTTVEKFITAESALVNKQIELAGQEKKVWAGWRNISKGAFARYGDFLSQGKFDEILELIKEL